MGEGRILKSLTLLALATAVAVPPVYAQAMGRVSGIITNAVSGAPVGQARVMLVGASDTVLTDSQGQYEFEQVTPGLVRVRAQLIGYLPITSQYYTILPDSTTFVDFKLAPLTVELDALEVEGERAGRANHAVGGQVITPEQLPKRGSVLDALQGVVAGLQVSGRRDQTQVVSRSSHAPVLYVVDGNVITPPLTFYIDTRDVECVEVRRGYRSTMEFRRSITGETYSGVILIWTRGSLDEQKPAGCV